MQQVLGCLCVCEDPGSQSVFASVDFLTWFWLSARTAPSIHFFVGTGDWNIMAESHNAVQNIDICDFEIEDRYQTQWLLGCHFWRNCLWGLQRQLMKTYHLNRSPLDILCNSLLWLNNAHGSVQTNLNRACDKAYIQSCGWQVRCITTCHPILNLPIYVKPQYWVLGPAVLLPWPLSDHATLSVLLASSPPWCTHSPL